MDILTTKAIVRLINDPGKMGKPAFMDGSARRPPDARNGNKHDGKTVADQSAMAKLWSVL
jgi:hypothetical protein